MTANETLQNMKKNEFFVNFKLHKKTNNYNNNYSIIKLYNLIFSEILTFNL